MGSGHSLKIKFVKEAVKKRSLLARMDSLKNILSFVLRTEWDDTYLYDDADIREQLAYDLAFFQPFEAVTEEADASSDTSEEDDMPLEANDDEADVTEDAGDGEDDEVEEEDDFIDVVDPMAPCCDRNCVVRLRDSSRCVSRLSSLKQSEKRRYLHMALAFSINVDSPETARKKAKRDNSTNPVERRLAFHYAFLGVPICVEALCLIFGVSHRMLDNAQKSLREGHIYPPPSRRGVHRRGVQFLRTREFFIFMNAYANEFGHPSPCGRGSKRDKPVIYLSATQTKKAVHELYSAKMAELGVKPLLYTTFVDTWNR